MQQAEAAERVHHLKADSLGVVLVVQELEEMVEQNKIILLEEMLLLMDAAAVELDLEQMVIAYFQKAGTAVLA